MRENPFLKQPKIDQQAFLKERDRTKKRKGKPSSAFEDEFEYGAEDKPVKAELDYDGDDAISVDSEKGYEEERVGANKLSPNDARLIGEVEAEVYKDNEELINGAEDFWEDLDEAESENGNFSHGFFHKGKLVGYIVGYKDESEANEDEEVAYVSDIAILPEHRKGMVTVRLLKAFIEDAKQAGLSIEAECRENSYKLVSKGGFLSKFGYKLASTKKMKKYHGGEDFYWVRLELTS